MSFAAAAVSAPSAAPQPRFRAPAPAPLERPLGTLALLRGLRDNPVATWTKLHFEKPILSGRSVLGRLAVVSDPAVVRHVLVDNADNYDKGLLQRRMLAPGLGSGLLLAEGEEWRAQRRALAPMFSPRHVQGFEASMGEAAADMAERWGRRRDGRLVDVSAEMARVTLRILGRTIFSDALTRTEEEFTAVVSRFLDTIGRIDPLDVLGMPDWVPRWGRIRSRPMLRFFESAVDSMVLRRRSVLEKDPEAAPRDLLTLLLRAVDPETGRGLSDVEIKANLVTFLIAGHETTSNALTWSLFLLSQDAAARAEVEREADQHLPQGAFVPGTLEQPRAHTRRDRGGHAALPTGRNHIAPGPGAGQVGRPSHQGREHGGGVALCAAPAQAPVGLPGAFHAGALSCRRTGAGSIASAICRSGPDRGCASAPPSRCRRPWWCWRP